MKNQYQNEWASLLLPLMFSSGCLIGNYLNIFGLLWRMKIVTIVGTRPNFMKAAPLINEFKKYKEIKHILIHTGQHYDTSMSKLFFDDLGMPKPDEYLNAANSESKDIKVFIKTEIKKALKRH